MERSRFLNSNATQWRFIRALVAVVIGLVLAYTDFFIRAFSIADVLRPWILAIVVLAFTAIIGAVSGNDKEWDEFLLDAEDELETEAEEEAAEDEEAAEIELEDVESEASTDETEDAEDESPSEEVTSC